MLEFSNLFVQRRSRTVFNLLILPKIKRHITVLVKFEIFQIANLSIAKKMMALQNRFAGLVHIEKVGELNLTKRYF